MIKQKLENNTSYLVNSEKPDKWTKTRAKLTMWPSTCRMLPAIARADEADATDFAYSESRQQLSFKASSGMQWKIPQSAATARRLIAKRKQLSEENVVHIEEYPQAEEKQDWEGGDQSTSNSQMEYFADVTDFSHRPRYLVDRFLSAARRRARTNQYQKTNCRRYRHQPKDRNLTANAIATRSSSALNPQQSKLPRGSLSSEIERETKPSSPTLAEILAEMPPVPTTEMSLHKGKRVMIKIGTLFLTAVGSCTPETSKIWPKLRSDVPRKCQDQEALVGYQPRMPWLFPYHKLSGQNCVFLVDQEATMKQTKWYRFAQVEFRLRIGMPHGRRSVPFHLGIKDWVYDQKHVVFRQDRSAWWRVTALPEGHSFVAESLQYPGRCLMQNGSQVELSKPLTNTDRVNISKGVWPRNMIISIFDCFGRSEKPSIVN